MIGRDHIRLAVGALVLLYGLPFGARGQGLHLKTALSDWKVGRIDSIRHGEISIFRGVQDAISLGLLADHPPAAMPTGERLSRAPQVYGDVAWVAEFFGEQINRLGGGFSTYSRSPSSGTTTIVTRSPEGARLRFEYSRREEGFCGVWVQLYDPLVPLPSRIYCDARDFSTLLLWVRGDQGGERFSVRLADREREQREYSIPLAYLGDCTPAGRITKEWQLARIPLDRAPEELLLSELALLVFEAEGVENSAIELRQAAFSMAPDVVFPLLEGLVAPARTEVREKGIWVWSTDTLLSDPGEQDAFIDFLGTGGYTTAYLAIPYARRDLGSLRGLPVHQEGFRRLLRRMRGVGVAGEALFGDMEFVKREHHPFLFASVENIVAFNQTAAPDERFLGIHLDVEPYLLPGFMAKRRRELTENYIELLRGVRKRCTDAGLQLAVDIPFWYDISSEFADDSTGRGEILDRILGEVDRIVVMAYRTTAFGVDGVLWHSTEELRRAAAQHRRVVIGLESGSLPEEEIWSFSGPPTSAPPGGKEPFVRIEAEGDTATFFLHTGGTEEDRTPIPEAGFRFWRARREAVVPSGKLTFWESGARRMEEVIRATVKFLSVEPAFDGIALHHYGSLWRLRP